MLEVCKYFEVIVGKPADAGFIVESCSEHFSELKDYYIFCKEQNRAVVRKCLENSLRSCINHALKLYDDNPATALNFLILSSGCKSYTELYVNECGNVKAFISKYSLNETTECDNAAISDDKSNTEHDNENSGFRKNIFTQNNAKSFSDNDITPHKLTAFGDSTEEIDCAKDSVDNNTKVEDSEIKQDDDEAESGALSHSTHDDNELEADISTTKVQTDAVEAVGESIQQSIKAEDKEEIAKADNVSNTLNATEEDKNSTTDLSQENIIANAETHSSQEYLEQLQNQDLERETEPAKQSADAEPLQIIKDVQNVMANKYFTSTGRFKGVDESMLLESLKELRDLDKRIALDTLDPDYVLSEEQLLRSADIVNTFGPAIFKSFFIEMILSAKDDRERIRVSALLDDFISYVNERSR